jgi:hypothetical protein
MFRRIAVRRSLVFNPRSPPLWHVAKSNVACAEEPGIITFNEINATEEG